MKKDYSYAELFPGRFIKAEDFQGRDITLTVKDVDLEELEDQRGKKWKCIVSFVEVKKQLVLVKTNGECVKGMFGVKVRGWVGKRITFFPEKGTFFGKRQEAVRVRGSPDLAADMTFTCKVGRDEPFEVTMKKTAPKGNGKAATAPAPDPDIPPGVDDSDMPVDGETGEVLS